MDNKISIVTVVYNDKEGIASTIESVLCQSYKDVEYIVIDGDSSDGTVNIINQYAKRLAYFVSEPDVGLYDAMNKGIKASSGDWILFLNSGDSFFNEEVLSDVFLDKKYETDIIYGSTVYVYNDGAVLRRPQSLNIIKKELPFCHQSAFVNANIMRGYLFDIKYKIIADYDFFLKCYKEGLKFQEVSKIIALYEGESGISASINNGFDMYKERCNILNQNISYFNFYMRFIIKTIKRIVLSTIPSSLVDKAMRREKGTLKRKDISLISQL